MRTRFLQEIDDAENYLKNASPIMLEMQYHAYKLLVVPVLAAVFFLGTAVSLVLLMDQMQKSMRVVTRVVLGLASIGLGYYQRPKAKKEIVQTVQPSPQSSKLAGIVNVKTPNIAEKAQRPDEPVPTEISASIPAPNLQTAEKSIKFGSDLTLVKGIGERRAAQLKSSTSTVSTN